MNSPFQPRVEDEQLSPQIRLTFLVSAGLVAAFLISLLIDPSVLTRRRLTDGVSTSSNSRWA